MTLTGIVHTNEIEGGEGCTLRTRTNVNVLLNHYCLLPSGSGSCRTITSLVRRLRRNRLYVRAGLKSTIADVNESAPAVSFLGFHAAIYEPKGVDVARDVAENG